MNETERLEAERLEAAQRLLNELERKTSSRHTNTIREQLFDDIRAAGKSGLLVVGAEREAALSVLVQQGRVSSDRGRAKAIHDFDIPSLSMRRALFPEIYE